MIPDFKKCSHCKLTLSSDNFNTRRKKRSNGTILETLYYICKKCKGIQKKEYYKIPENREKKNEALRVRRINDPEFRNKVKGWHLKHYFNMSFEEYSTMFKKQNGCCAICSRPDESLAVDHCHSTNKIRKLLCRNCNLSLGFCNDNIEILEKMILYLKEFQLCIT